MDLRQLHAMPASANRPNISQVCALMGQACADCLLCKDAALQERIALHQLCMLAFLNLQPLHQLLQLPACCASQLAMIPLLCFWQSSPALVVCCSGPIVPHISLQLPALWHLLLNSTPAERMTVLADVTLGRAAWYIRPPMALCPAKRPTEQCSATGNTAGSTVYGMPKRCASRAGASADYAHAPYKVALV